MAHIRNIAIRSQKFQRNVLKDYLKKQYPENLQNWPSLDFKGFLKELQKAKVKLSLEEEAEWMEYFSKQKAKVQELQAEVDRLDKEIDRMVC